MKKAFLLILPIFAFAAPAQAQDTGGLRVELMGFYDNINTELGVDDDEFNPARDRDVDGAFGIGIGYDFLSGAGLNLGIDVEATHSTGNRDILVDNSVVGSVDFRDDLYVGGRVTFPVSENFNLYGKLGYTGLRVRADIEDEDFEDEYDSERLNGIRGGVGFQYSSDDKTYYGVEYRFSDYESNVERHQVGVVVGVRF